MRCHCNQLQRRETFNHNVQIVTEYLYKLNAVLISHCIIWYKLSLAMQLYDDGSFWRGQVCSNVKHIIRKSAGSSRSSVKRFYRHSYRYVRLVSFMPTCCCRSWTCSVSVLTVCSRWRYWVHEGHPARNHKFHRFNQIVRTNRNTID